MLGLYGDNGKEAGNYSIIGDTYLGFITCKEETRQPEDLQPQAGFSSSRERSCPPGGSVHHQRRVKKCRKTHP